jgi:hypothetical protein
MATISPALTSSLFGGLARALGIPAIPGHGSTRAAGPAGASKLNADFADVLLLHSLTQGASLVGKTVLYNPAGASQVKKGQVNSVAVDNGKIALIVSGNKIMLNQVRGVV